MELEYWNDGRTDIFALFHYSIIPMFQLSLSASASTVTLTARTCSPPPLMTPRNGVTSEKSRPHPRVICSREGSTLLVGSRSIQPLPGTNSAAHAWEASAPRGRCLPGAGRLTRKPLAHAAGTPGERKQ